MYQPKWGTVINKVAIALAVLLITIFPLKLLSLCHYVVEILINVVRINDWGYFIIITQLIWGNKCEYTLIEDQNWTVFAL